MSEIYVSDRRINRKKSTNPYAKLSYRQLQKVARTMNLPTYPRFKLLLALVIAKSIDRADMVNLIQNYLTMNEQIDKAETIVQDNDVSVIVCNSTGDNFAEILDSGGNLENSVEIADENVSEGFNLCEVVQILGGRNE